LIIYTFPVKQSVSYIFRSPPRVYKHVHCSTFGLQRRRKAGQLQNRPMPSITTLFAEPKKKRTQNEQLNLKNVIFIALSFICFLICMCIFYLFTPCGLLFIAFYTSCFLCMCRTLVCETLGGELRRMTWTLGIMTLFGRCLAVLYLAHTLIYYSLFIFCFLFQLIVQFLLFSALLISIHYPPHPFTSKIENFTHCKRQIKLWVSGLHTVRNSSASRMLYRNLRFKYRELRI